MKKKIIIFFFILLILAYPILKTKAYFTAKDINNNNYISIGSINLNKFDDISMFVYVAKGPALNLGVEIFDPYKLSYNWTKKLSDSPYFNWAKNRRSEIVESIKRKNNIESISKSNTNFANINDDNFFTNNYVAFDGNNQTAFFNNEALHLFVVISNNAHLVKNPKKINIMNEHNLNISANVDFRGETSSNVFTTNYNSTIDIYNKKYYVTTAYSYNEIEKRYYEPTRGNWYFYNDADLIIIDLGTTGLEDSKADLIYSENKNKLVPKLLFYMIHSNDTKARIIKSDYTVTFTPSWDSNKTLKQSIMLK